MRKWEWIMKNILVDQMDRRKLGFHVRVVRGAWWANFYTLRSAWKIAHAPHCPCFEFTPHALRIAQRALRTHGSSSLTNRCTEFYASRSTHHAPRTMHTWNPSFIPWLLFYSVRVPTMHSQPIQVDQEIPAVTAFSGEQRWFGPTETTRCR